MTHFGDRLIEASRRCKTPLCMGIDPHPGISFIVSRRTGNAVLRNKFKRRCRALFQQYHTAQLKNYKIIIKPKKTIKNHYSWNDLSLSFKEFCTKLRV